MAADVTNLNGVAVPTLNGATLVVSVEGDQVLLNDVAIIATDIEASNGVIHVVDAVLLPPAASAADPDEAGVSEAPASESTANAAEAPSGCSADYHVQRGDTLSEIAAVYGVDMQELAEANGIRNANYIYRGQRLCIP